MLQMFWLLLFLLGVCLFLLMPMLWGREIYNHYRGSRAVSCPETHQPVAVSFDALHAAVTGLSGRPSLRLAACTRWPTRMDCDQECIPEARRSKEYTQGEVDLAKDKKIYHLPVLMAAFLAWVLGAIWHSQYMFRELWMDTLGLTKPEVRQILWWRVPHLLTMMVPLLFAYGVAWLLAVRGRKGVWQGIITSTFLWVAVAVASLASTRWAGISVDLLKMETAYTLLASLAIGAIVGGLSGKLVEQTFEEK